MGNTTTPHVIGITTLSLLNYRNDGHIGRTNEIGFYGIYIRLADHAWWHSSRNVRSRLAIVFSDGMCISYAGYMPICKIKLVS